MDRITNPTGPGDPPRIRDTEISVWDVYRDLAFHGIAEDKVLQNHPKLEPEDLNAVREFVATSIKSRTHDEFTGRPILRKEQLRHEAVYRGDAEMGALPDGTLMSSASTIGGKRSGGSTSRPSAFRQTRRSSG